MTSKDITEIFKKFNSLKVLVIGDVMIDSYLWGKVERISPEAPVPIVTVNRRENRLGGAANVALNLQALGATPVLCTVIGDESKGLLFTELLDDQNLSKKGIIKSKNRITTTKFRIIGNHTQMLRVDEEIDAGISEKETEMLYEVIEKLTDTEKIDVIIFEDYDKGVISSLLIKKVTDLALKKTIPVAADPKRKNFTAYRNITLFKPNLKELKEGLKFDFSTKNLSDLEKVVDDLQIKNNIDIVMVTLSEAGVYLSLKDHKSNTIVSRHNIPAQVRNIADVSGAGDTVISVAALCLALKLNPYSIATLANLAGGLVCEEVGVVPVNKAKLIKEALTLSL
ncbi:MAG: bifunctional ADP-heptose synthase [Bacteroidales bacterium]